MKKYPHGTVITWDFLGIPEQFCSEGQFINCTNGQGMQIQDIDHPDNAGYRLTINSIRSFDPTRKNKMNEITTDTAVPETAVAEAPVLVFNPETGEFEAVTVLAVTEEGPVAEAGEVTVH